MLKFRILKSKNSNIDFSTTSNSHKPTTIIINDESFNALKKQGKLRLQGPNMLGLFLKVQACEYSLEGLTPLEIYFCRLGMRT